MGALASRLEAIPTKKRKRRTDCIISLRLSVLAECSERECIEISVSLGGSWALQLYIVVQVVWIHEVDSM